MTVDRRELGGLGGRGGGENYQYIYGVREAYLSPILPAAGVCVSQCPGPIECESHPMVAVGRV